MKKGSGTFVPEENESVRLLERKRRESSGRPDALSPEEVAKDEAFRRARKENPYFDQGGGCNW